VTQGRPRRRRDGPPAGHQVVWLPGGELLMGSDVHEPEEAPAHRVLVSAFGIDRLEVTNRQFAQFVADTGHVTVAERPVDAAEFPGAPPENLVPGSLVFTPTPGPVDLRHLSQWWTWVPGSCWRRPEGAGSGLSGRWDHPVVHVAFEDVTAYAAWAGAVLPTEAQWELAARGGIEGAAYTWGDEPRPGGRLMANTWDGPDFPWRSTGESGFLRTSPVGSFPPNGFGLHDMAGNVWEWTDDWWTSQHAGEPGSCCGPAAARDPRPGDEAGSIDAATPQFRTPRKVVKGGSHLCADTYCLRYRPAARRPQAVDTGMSHVGFRCAWVAPQATEG
jgi:sulfatase modifying factor 1